MRALADLIVNAYGYIKLYVNFSKSYVWLTYRRNGLCDSFGRSHIRSMRFNIFARMVALEDHTINLRV